MIENSALQVNYATPLDGKNKIQLNNQRKEEKQDPKNIMKRKLLPKTLEEKLLIFQSSKIYKHNQQNMDTDKLII